MTLWRHPRRLKHSPMRTFDQFFRTAFSFRRVLDRTSARTVRWGRTARCGAPRSSSVLRENFPQTRQSRATCVDIENASSKALRGTLFSGASKLSFRRVMQPCPLWTSVDRRAKLSRTTPTAQFERRLFCCVCQACAVGTYQPSEGKAACIACGKGRFCGEGYAAEKDCAAGSFCPTPSSQLPCTSDGAYCPEQRTATEAQQEKPCPAGSFCAVPTIAVACGAGTFCPEGSASEQPCPSGFYCTLPSVKVQCEGGHHCPQGSTAQKACDRGSFSADPRLPYVLLAPLPVAGGSVVKG